MGRKQAEADPLIAKAASAAGGRPELAAALGVSTVTIHKLYWGEMRPSWRIASKIEQLYGISRAELCPDVYAAIPKAKRGR